MELIIRFVIILLVPLIPTWILFRYLPSKAIVKGPFQGLAINLGGAAAVYFLLVLVSLGYFQIKASGEIEKLISEIPPNEVWKVKGTVALEGIGPPAFEYDTILLTVIPMTDFDDIGGFSIHVPVMRKSNGQLDFPKLQVTATNFDVDVADLGKSQWVTYDTSAKEIVLRDTLKLRPAGKEQ